MKVTEGVLLGTLMSIHILQRQEAASQVTSSKQPLTPTLMVALE